MAIANVQKTNGAVATSPLTVTFGSTPIQGNLLIAVLTQQGSLQTADSTIAGFTAVAAMVGYTGSGTTSRRLGIFYKIAGASESSSVVATAGANSTLGALDMAILEYSGLATSSSSVFDQVANDGNNTGTNTTSRTSGTTSATTQADELAIVAYGLAGSTSGISYSNGFTSEQETVRLGVASKVLSTVGTQESTRTWTTTRGAGGQIATFKGFVSMLPQQVIVGPPPAVQRAASW